MVVFDLVDQYWPCRVCTCEVEGKGDEAVVFAEDAQRLLPLHQREEVIRHRLTVEEVVHAQQEVPTAKSVKTPQLSDSSSSPGYTFSTPVKSPALSVRCVKTNISSPLVFTGIVNVRRSDFLPTIPLCWTPLELQIKQDQRVTGCSADWLKILTLTQVWNG